jgi:hypothetical protein
VCIVRHAVALVLLALAGTACGARQDPLAAMGGRDGAFAAGIQPAAESTATRTAMPSAEPGTTQPARATCRAVAVRSFPATAWWATPE